MRMLLAAACAVVVSTSASAEMPGVQTILKNYEHAIGGKAAMDAIKTTIVRGSYKEGDYENDKASLSKMRPYYKLVGDAEHPSKEFAEGYDGSTWEYYGDPIGIVLRTVTAASSAGRHATDIIGPLSDLKEQRYMATLEGTEKIGDRDAYRVRITMPDGFQQDEFVDAKSWLLIAERKVAPVHAFGEGVKSETRWSDFRRVNGVLFPFRSDEVEIATGNVLNSFITREIVVNHPLDVAVFSPPEFKHTPLQTLIETLFVERDDPKTVMWTYFDFRRAHPDIDTDNAIRIAGYQILKTGQTESVVQLLTENAKTYPKSSEAAFGLGRALHTAGRDAEARKEFERALKLDAKNKRAADALKDLDKAKESGG